MRYAFVLSSAILLAQDPKFGVQSRLVMVPVTVTDEKGRSINDLGVSDFLIYDNGAVQRGIVDSFTTGVAPVALVIAVQSSGISAPALAKVQKIGAMIQPLISGERGCAALVTFDETVRWRQDCTNHPDALGRAFQGLQPVEGKRARMLDAVHQAVQRLGRRPKSRRVLLLISESRDRGSETELEASVMAAQGAGVTVYAATYSGFRTAFTSKASKNETPQESDIPRASRTQPLTHGGRVTVPPPEQRVDLRELLRLAKTKDTEALTTETGGVTFPFTRLKGLEEAIMRLGDELHGQYVLSFVPETPLPGYHRLGVRVNRPGKFRVRARPGYWSSR
jgi:VWFA-related protein